MEADAHPGLLNPNTFELTPCIQVNNRL